jgi:hypothetical protein
MDVDAKTIELLRVVLIRCDKYSFLPELYDVFGGEATIKFLQIFAGCSFTVPKQDVIKQALQDVEIYRSVSRLPTKDTIEFLSQEYELPRKLILAAYKNVCHALDQEPEEIVNYAAEEDKEGVPGETGEPG